MTKLTVDDRRIKIAYKIALFRLVILSGLLRVKAFENCHITEESLFERGLE